MVHLCPRISDDLSSRWEELVSILLQSFSSIIAIAVERKAAEKPKWANLQNRLANEKGASNFQAVRRTLGGRDSQGQTRRGTVSVISKASPQRREFCEKRAQLSGQMEIEKTYSLFLSQVSRGSENDNDGIILQFDVPGVK
jgi:hypothetical protein